MHFESRQPPEGINTSKDHPLIEFSQLIIGVLVLTVVLIVTLSWFGEALARKIPFKVESQLAETFEPETSSSASHPELNRYLKELSQRVIKAMPLNESYQVVVHYQNSETVNAFATLGGHMLLFKGLLEQLPHENALLMLIAHEIAHIQHRDPIVGLGKGVFVQIGMAALFGYSPQADKLLGQAGLLHSLSYSREMETAADDAALETIFKLTGHINGAIDLFELLQAQKAASNHAAVGEEFFRTHPLDEKRIAHLHQLAKAQNWPESGDITTLPDDFQAWLESEQTSTTH